MKTHEVVKMTKAEEAFTGTTVVVLFFFLPAWGAKAMMVGSIVGLIAYILLFRDLLHKRGWMAVALVTVSAAIIAFGIEVALAKL